MPCRLMRNQSVFSGMVVDVSRTGLFVQTSAAARVGDEVEIKLMRRGSDDEIVLNTRVVWQRKVPHQLRSAVEGGLGLRIRYAPEPYYVLLAEASQGLGPGRVRAV